MRSTLAFSLLLLGMASAFSLSSDSPFPADYKSKTMANVVLDWAAHQTSANTTPLGTTHYVQFRVKNNRPQRVDINLAGKNLSTLFNGAFYGTQFYEQTAWQNYSYCNTTTEWQAWNYTNETTNETTFYNESVNTTNCTFSYRLDFTPTAFTNLTLASGQQKSFLIAIQTAQFAQGIYNISIRGNGGFDWFIDPDISACTVISSAGIYAATGNMLTTTSTECLNITADDVWVNCNFYNVSVISTSTSTIKSAIKIAKTPSAAIKNVSITNCRINGTYLVYGIQSAFAQNYNYQGNTFEDWTGRAAANGNNGTTTCTNGGNGQASYAIHLAGNTNGTIRDNVFRNGYGGKAGAGGNKTTSGTACNGGIGGALYGIYITVLTATKTKNTTIVNNTFDNFTTGDSNNGGNSPGNGGNGNKPGTGAFIYLNGAWAEETGVFNNSFGTISSGIPGNGGQTLSACIRCGLCAFLNGDGGDSSTVYWLYFSSSTKLIVKGNTFGTVKTHKGGTGATGGNMYAGAGGSGGWAIGCYATGTNQTIDGNVFVNVTPGDGGDNGAGSCDKGKVPGNGGMGIAFEMGGATTINNFSVFNVSHGIAYKGHGTYDGVDGNGTAVYFEAAQGTNITNGDFLNLADETVLSSSQVGIGGTTANNNLFLNVSMPFWIVNWDNSGGDYTCDPNCNFSVAWYGKISVIGNSTPVTLNVSDNYSALSYLDNLQSSPWFIANDSVFDSFNGDAPNRTFNAHNCSANTSTATNWTYFNYSARDLTCEIPLFSIGVTPYLFRSVYKEGEDPPLIQKAYIFGLSSDNMLSPVVVLLALAVIFGYMYINVVRGDEKNNWLGILLKLLFFGGFWISAWAAGWMAFNSDTVTTVNYTNGSFTKTINSSECLGGFVLTNNWTCLNSNVSAYNQTYANNLIRNETTPIVLAQTVTETIPTAQRGILTGWLSGIQALFYFMLFLYGVGILYNAVVGIQKMGKKRYFSDNDNEKTGL